MRFSWPALLVAPLVVPLLLGAMFAVSSRGDPWLSFLLLFALAAAVSYGAAVFLLLPSLYLVSRRTSLTAWRTGLVGLALGLATYVPAGWISHRISGDNSGPPMGTFGEYLWQQGPSEAWLFLAAGLMTTLLYWFLSNPGATGKRGVKGQAS